MRCHYAARTLTRGSGGVHTVALTTNRVVRATIHHAATDDDPHNMGQERRDGMGTIEYCPSHDSTVGYKCYIPADGVDNIVSS
jgi:hypothetical protein